MNEKRNIPILSYLIFEAIITITVISSWLRFSNAKFSGALELFILSYHVFSRIIVMLLFLIQPEEDMLVAFAVQVLVVCFFWVPLLLFYIQNPHKKTKEKKILMIIILIFSSIFLIIFIWLLYLQIKNYAERVILRSGWDTSRYNQYRRINPHGG
jgi:hypothetical protein